MLREQIVDIAKSVRIGRWRELRLTLEHAWRVVWCRARFHKRALIHWTCAAVTQTWCTRCRLISRPKRYGRVDQYGRFVK